MPGSARFLRGLECSANDLQVRLRYIGITQLTFEDSLDDLLGSPQFSLFLSQAGKCDSAVGEFPFLHSQTPVFVDAAAEAVLSAPRKIILNVHETEELDV
jgi:hypothetical protein